MSRTAQDPKQDEVPPVELNEEQQKYLNRMILADRMREHRAIAGDQAYRLAYFYVLNDCNRGLYDPELANILRGEWEEFRAKNPVLGTAPVKKPEKKE